MAVPLVRFGLVKSYNILLILVAISAAAAPSFANSEISYLEQEISRDLVDFSLFPKKTKVSVSDCNIEIVTNYRDVDQCTDENRTLNKIVTISLPEINSIHFYGPLPRGVTVHFRFKSNIANALEEISKKMEMEIDIVRKGPRDDEAQFEKKLGQVTSDVVEDLNSKNIKYRDILTSCSDVETHQPIYSEYHILLLTSQPPRRLFENLESYRKQCDFYY
ncbi:MAG: hypothetical protein OEY05_01090 [Paracoccaceae bacterium]|nr:hypothetical protein [Paracoccaceae bacterium]